MKRSLTTGLRKRESGLAPQVARRGPGAFTVIEIMLAISIFSMVLTAIYASWSSILRASKLGADAATEIQRSRVASRTLQDALVSAVMFAGNAGLYRFEADTSSDFAALSFVARLPASFPGSGYFGDQVVRRVDFSVEQGKNGANMLMLRQIPLLQTNLDQGDEHSILLARDVNLFGLEFWDVRKNEWIGEWLATNSLPKLVRFTLAFGNASGAKLKPEDITTRTVSIASAAVQADWQMPRGGAGPPVNPGGPPINPGGPAVNPGRTPVNPGRIPQ